MKDPDTNLFASLIEGVSTGFHDRIAPSNVFPLKEAVEEPERPELSIHWSNWQTAEAQPELTKDLIQEEIDKGWLIQFDGPCRGPTKISFGGCRGKTGYRNI